MPYAQYRGGGGGGGGELVYYFISVVYAYIQHLRVSVDISWKFGRARLESKPV